jgi:pyroglutamyl-peptidase
MRSSTSDRERARAQGDGDRVALLTGFEPYNGSEVNPSGEVARALDSSVIRGVRVVGRLLPVSAATTPGCVRAAIDDVEPDVVLMLGVWPGRHAFSIERIAVNVLDFPFPDNDGAKLADLPVIEDGPAAFFSTAPVRVIADAWREVALPGGVSNTAGTYLCNQSFYAALHHTAGSGLPVAFVHIPTVPSEASRHDPPLPSMALATLLQGVTVALETLITVTLSARS